MKMIVGAFVLIVGFIAYVRFMEAAGIFFPSPQVAQDPSALGLNFEDIYFTTKDKVKLNGWFMKAPKAASTILFLHGNAGNIGDRLDKVQLFYKMGLNVFIADYRCYGKSQGHPTEKGMYQDALAAWDYLLTRKDINP